MGRVPRFFTCPIHTPQEVTGRLDHGGMIVSVASIAIGVLLWGACGVAAKIQPAFFKQLTLGQHCIYILGGYAVLPTLGYTFLALRYLNDKRRLRKEGL